MKLAMLVSSACVSPKSVCKASVCVSHVLATRKDIDTGASHCVYNSACVMHERCPKAVCAIHVAIGNEPFMLLNSKSCMFVMP